LNNKSENIGLLRDVSRIHLIGIGGIGMSGIAEFFARKGYDVSGSDIILSEITKRLKDFGIKILEGHNESNILGDADLVIYTSAVKENNPEFIQAINNGKKLVKRSVMLGEIVNDMFLISVGGTHGKTTTTSMLAKALIDNGFDPTVFVGGSLDFLEGGSSRIGKSRYALVEADEYDRSFLTLKSDLIVITNIEMDHSDIYADEEDVLKGFIGFCNNRKPDSAIIGCGDDKNTLNVLALQSDCKKLFYGFNDSNNYIARNVSVSHGEFNYDVGNENVKLNVPGYHNVLNSLAVFAVCEHLKISSEAIIKSIESFHGVDRRLQIKYRGDIDIYDDYAHHPTEVKESLKAIKLIARGRVITVFQPHLYSRTKDFYKEFAAALAPNDILILAKIYPAREKEIKGISSELIMESFGNNSGKEIYYIDNFNDIISKLDDIKKSGDTIIFQGAGDITILCADYIKHIKSIKNEE